MDAAIRHGSFGPIQLELHAQELGYRLRSAKQTGAVHRKHLLQFRKNVRLIETSHRTAVKWASEAGTHSPVVEWLLDNYPVIRERIRDVLVHLPRKYFVELPRLEDGPPRIQIIAEELILHSDASLDDGLIIQFVNNVQERCELTIGECWALGTFLKLSLIERLRFICADMEADYRSSRKTQQFLDQLEKSQSYDREDLRSLDDNSSLVHLHIAASKEAGLPASLKVDVQDLIQSKGLSLEELQRIEQQRLAACQVSIGNVITSLRLLDELDWPSIFEAVNVTEQVLRSEATKIYERMDFQSRNQYRAAIEELSTNSKASESQIARFAIQAANKEYYRDTKSRDPKSHIGYWLIDRGRETLSSMIQYRPGIRRRFLNSVRANPNIAYLGFASLLTMFILVVFGIAFNSLGVSLLYVIPIVLLVSIVISEIAIQFVNAFWTQVIPVHLLAKLELDDELPARHPTIVVVPSMLTSERVINILLTKLESHFLANADLGLKFGLLTDYADSDSPTDSKDDSLLRQAIEGIEKLNERHQTAHGTRPFYLFHRRRVWNDKERKWMGWERKRGKLLEFGNYLLGKGQVHFEVCVGDLKALSSFQDSSLEPFVITLDADTILPRDTARRLVGTLAHPLNRPQFDGESRMVTQGYCILQPRVSIQMENDEGSLYHQLFATFPGIDPYAVSASDIYQDIYHEGSFTGKGIYDLRAFELAMEARFPENRILSHDLIEGCYARAAFVSDIEVFDSYPQRYDADARRLHRWTRGDWQIAAWLLPYVPSLHSIVRNRISLLSRWKIFDNLRRSLVPISLILLLLFSLLMSASASLLISLIAAWVVLWPTALSAIFGLRSLKEIFADAGTDRRGYLRSYADDVWRSFVRSVFLASMLPHRAWLMADAIFRTYWRIFISHSNLLEWETAYASETRLLKKKHTLVFQLMPTALFGFMLIFVTINQHQFWMLPWACLWMAAPVIAHTISSVRKRKSLNAPVEENAFLHEVLSSTWGYFERFVDPSVHPLPPDNFQESPAAKIAHRISPTNEGLFLVSSLVARHVGLLTHHRLAEILERNIEAWLALERYNGHHFNWYETKSGRALQPRYVSTVDSGNLLACYITLAHGIQSENLEPVLGTKYYFTLRATMDWLQRVARPVDAEFVELLAGIRVSLATHEPSWRWTLELRKWLVHASTSVEEWARRFENKELDANDRRDLADVVHVANIVVQRFQNLLHEIDTFFGWILQDVGSNNVRDAALEDLERIFPPSISLSELSMFDLSRFDTLRSRFGTEKVNSFAQAVEHASQLASQLLGRYQKLQALMESEIANMQFGFLYNSKRKLFSIGYNAETLQLDKSYYDMLASECRLSSYLAISKGDIKTEHWFHLGRQSTEIDGRFSLLSWGGTMFEYLMPTLFQRIYPGSILERSCVAAVRRQIQYAEHKGHVWGISESAYSARANNSDYLYKSFGVPGLGLKRGLNSEYVVSPYSSVLALPFMPQESLANLGELNKIAFGTWGFYDAIDFTKSRLRRREPHIVVRNYMAHHHGMTILAIANSLDRWIVQRWFHASPLVKASELLLQEKTPSVVTIDKPDENEIDDSIVLKKGEEILTRRIRGYRASPPKTLLLSNRRAHTWLTHVGGSCFRWNDIQVTRWRPDLTRDHWGTHIYLRDQKSGLVWSAAYQPTRVEPDEYEAHFSVDKGSIRQRQGSIETMMEVTVSPEHDAEVRLLKISNLGFDSVTLDVTSFAEIALVNERADLAHTAFSKLFVETEFVEEDNSIVAKRRSRDHRQDAIFAVHTIALPHQALDTIQYDSSRESFIGRGRTCESPQAVNSQRLARNVGPVIDPAFALRCTLTVEPGDFVLVGFTTACATTREEVLKIADHYQEIRGVQRAFELSWAQSQIEMQHLNLSAQEIHTFQRLGGHLIYPNRAMRGESTKIISNRLNQSSLWRFGISGDHPMILTRITSDEDVAIAKQLLIACRYLVSRGLQMELVLCNDYPVSYFDEIQNRLQSLVDETLLGEDFAKQVFVLRGAQLTREDHSLVDAVSTVLVRGDRGSLANQLDVAPSRFSQTNRTTQIGEKRTPSSTSDKWQVSEREREPKKTPVAAGQFANGFGEFHSGSYRMKVSSNQMTPAPWSNVISNPEFGCLITESGSGFTWYRNSRENKLSTWSNDPTSDPPSEVLYLYDLDTDGLWSPLNSLVSPNLREVEHRHGESLFRVDENGIKSETMVSVDWNAPIKKYRLKLSNNSRSIRRLRVTFYVETVLGVNRESTFLHQHSSIHGDGRAISMENGFHTEFPNQIIFLSSNNPGCRFTGDRTEFLDPFGSYARPVGAIYRLTNNTGAALDPCLAVQCEVELQSDETQEIEFYLGAADNEEHYASLLKQLELQSSAPLAIISPASQWASILNSLAIETPNPSMDILFNDWLLYQTLSCRIWGRSAFYQSGGAYGFRDQLQDVLAMVYSRPELTREQILRAAARQYADGSVQHWWHPPSGKGTKTRFSDDFLFLPYAVCHYCTVTGDRSILEESVSFIESLPLLDHEQERYEQPTISTFQSSLLDHCKRALQHGMKYGEHGLPLMGCGDWNDGMNRIGESGKGESVWVGWFQVHVFRSFANLLEKYEPTEEMIELLRHTADDVHKAIETHAWDGQWYRRAFFEDGAPLGGSENDECQIDSLAQSWAVIVNGHTDRSELAFAEAVERLFDREAKILKLFEAPFDREQRDVGYIQGYLPGVRENGGQYTHAALWMVSAAAKMGDGDLAMELLDATNPIHHTLNKLSAQRYRLEPFVVAADIYSNPHLLGRGGWSWYTGSAGWMYRVVLEDILGLQFIDRRVTIRPAVPKSWTHFKIRLVRNTTTWNLTVQINQSESAKFDDEFIELNEDGQTHELTMVVNNRCSSTESNPKKVQVCRP